MSEARTRSYEFEDFRVEVDKRLLFRHGKPVRLTPKAFDTLLLLVQRKGEVISKDDLMREVWPDTAVEENNLNQNISTFAPRLRRKPWRESLHSHRARARVSLRPAS